MHYYYILLSFNFYRGMANNVCIHVLKWLVIKILLLRAISIVCKILFNSRRLIYVIYYG